MPILIVLGVAAVAGPVMAAVGAIVHVLIVTAAVVLGVSAVGMIGLLIWRWRRRLDAARTAPPTFSKVVRAASPLPKIREIPHIPTETGRELPGGIHLHFHGVDPAEVAEIIRRQQEDQ